MGTEKKTVEEWVKGLPEGRFKDRLWDALKDRLWVKYDSLEQVVELAYLMRAYEDDCPYFYGAGLWLEGRPRQDLQLPMAVDGYDDAKEAMEGGDK